MHLLPFLGGLWFGALDQTEPIAANKMMPISWNHLGGRNPSEALPVLFRGPFSGATGRRPGGANMVETTLAGETFWWDDGLWYQKMLSSNKANWHQVEIFAETCFFFLHFSRGRIYPTMVYGCWALSWDESLYSKIAELESLTTYIVFWVVK